MPFIPKIILLDKGPSGQFEAYDILAQRTEGVTADNMVKQYIRFKNIGQTIKLCSNFNISN